MIAAEWKFLWDQIVHLKQKIRRYLDPDNITTETELRDQRLKAEAAIALFYKDYAQPIVDNDAKLFEPLNQSFLIMEFRSNQVRRKLKDIHDALPASTHQLNPHLYASDALLQAECLDLRLSASLFLLEPFWEKEGVNGLESPEKPTEANLGHMEQQLETFQHDVQQVLPLADLGNLLHRIRENWVSYQNEVSWLLHLAKRCKE